MKDKTEELLPKNPEDKKFSKKTTWLIVGILTSIVVLVLVYNL